MYRKLSLLVIVLALALLAPGLAAAGPAAQAEPAPTAPDAPGRLLYNGSIEGAWQELFTMNADGTGQTRLTFRPEAYDGEAAWSPDGKRIAFVRQTAAYSPYQLYIMNADGSNLVHLADPADHPSRPTWSPDGAKLAFTVNNSGQLYIINSDGSGLIPVEGAAGHEPSWSPDGQLIAFAGYGVNGRSDIFVVKPDGAGLTNLTKTDSNDWSPDWSPDGSRIVFHRDFGGINMELYTMNRAGGDRVRLTNTPGPERWPSWSPDGKQIAYVAWTPNANDDLIAHVFTMNADGGNPRQITNGLGEFYPDWQPPAGGPKTTTFTPTNDAYVLSSQPNKVFNTPRLQVRDAAADMNAYLKFNLTGLSGAVQSATLRLWVLDPGPDGGQVYATSPYYQGSATLWYETGLTWANAPAIGGAPLDAAGAVAKGKWVELDVTAAISGNGRASFALSNDSANVVAYGSKEGARAPQLVVVTK